MASWNPEDPASAEQHWRETTTEDKKKELATIQQTKQEDYKQHSENLMTSMAGLMSKDNPAFAEAFGNNMRRGLGTAYSFASALETYGAYQKQQNEKNTAFNQDLAKTKTDAEAAKDTGMGSYYSAIGQSTLAKTPSEIAKSQAEASSITEETNRKNSLLPGAIAKSEAEAKAQEQKNDFTSRLNEVFKGNPELFKSLAEKMAGLSIASPAQAGQTETKPQESPAPESQPTQSQEQTIDPRWTSNLAPSKKKKPVFDFGLA